MADIRKQFLKIKELWGENNNLELSTEDALRFQDVLELMQERGYIFNFNIDNGNLYHKLADFKGFEEWLDEEYPQVYNSGTIQLSDAYQKFETLMEQGRFCKQQLGANAVKMPEGKTTRTLIDDWINDVDIFQQRHMNHHPLQTRIRSTIFHRKGDCFYQLLSMLESAERDQEFLAQLAGAPLAVVPTYQARNLPEYDVFISHANRDKEEFVDELNESLKKLGIKIFYDKEALEWGDNWKDRILNGVKKAEFAIIVISENFFDREWTEKELTEFLSRQNRNGQKIILPILHNISVAQLQEKYPSVADIQAIDSSKYSCDTIALKFAGQLIKRLKNT